LKKPLFSLLLGLSALTISIRRSLAGQVPKADQQEEKAVPLAQKYGQGDVHYTVGSTKM